MEQIAENKRDAFLSTFEHEAVHVEMRDVYATDIERDRFTTWLRGEDLDPDDEARWWQPWYALMQRNTEQGKTLKRLRIVSEPVTDYIRFEWLDAAQLVAAGEDVRWLPRRNASTLLLPGNDFWMFDRHTVAFTHFSGDGHVLDHEATTDSAIVDACAAAFDAAWKLAIPHNQYEPVYRGQRTG
ncbi:DUF6879 family protein [Herbihabitans rhizosphaerae]|uniref:DUF6879 family protein n=1 Tax=Herbihabitans rhizosphaerae TaxID=1872711 RepID=UPI001A93200E|nr:DUF6879 family protein [Herbihabitans rhizosphaerae]